MRPRLWHSSVPSSALLVLAAGLAVSSSSCRPTVPADVSVKPVAGQTLEDRSGLPKAERMDGRAGDVLLRNERLTVVVAAAPAAKGHRRRLGAIIDMLPTGSGRDLLQVLQPALRIDKEISAVAAQRVTPTPGGVLVEGGVEGRPDLEVRTLISLGGADTHVGLKTTIYNRGQGTLRDDLLDLVYLGNVSYFVPGVGSVQEESERDCPWFGRYSEGSSWLYAVAGAGLFPVRFKVTSIGDARFTGAARPFLGAARLGPGEQASWSRQVVSVLGNLSAATDVLASQTGPGGRRVEGSVRREDAEALVDGTTVWVRDLQGNPYTNAGVGPDGRFSLRLPPGGFRLIAVAPGTPGSAPMDVPPGDSQLEPLLLSTPGMLRYTVLDSSGARLPARLVIRGIAPTADPLLGESHRAETAGNTIYDHDGRGGVKLAPGRYELLATRGMEYDVARKPLLIEAGSTLEVTLRLERSLATPGAVAADFHLHAIGSGDSEIVFRDRVKSLVAEGIEFAVATDHNRISDYQKAVAELELGDWLGVAAGVEASTTGPVRWGHFNAFPLSQDLDLPGAGTPAHHETTPAALFAAIHAHPGQQVIQVNHPRMEPRIGYFDWVGLDPSTARASAPEWDTGFDAIEIFNGIWLNRPERVRRNLRDWFALLNAGHRFAGTGNSDSHRLVEQEVGYPRTYVTVDSPSSKPPSVASIVQAVRAGRTMVSSGPYITVKLDGRGPGETVASAGRSTLPLDVTVEAAPWVKVDQVEVIAGGRLVWKIPIPPSKGIRRFHGRFDIEAKGTGWVVVLATGNGYEAGIVALPGATPMAFTSPVFVDPEAQAPVTSENR